MNISYLYKQIKLVEDLFDAVYFIVLVVNIDGKVVFINSRGLRYLDIAKKKSLVKTGLMNSFPIG